MRAMRPVPVRTGPSREIAISRPRRVCNDRAFRIPPFVDRRPAPGRGRIDRVVRHPVPRGGPVMGAPAFGAPAPGAGAAEDPRDPGQAQPPPPAPEDAQPRRQQGPIFRPPTPAYGGTGGYYYGYGGYPAYEVNNVVL